MTVESLLYRFIRPLAPIWFANRYREQHAARLLARVALPYVSAVGVHCVGPRRTGYGPFLTTINSAGRMLSIVKTRDDHGASFDAKQMWPDVLTVGAFTQFDGLALDYAAFKARAALNPWIDYWEVGNEIDGEYHAQADKYISLMPTFAADGFGLEMFACASGTPKTPDEDGGAAYSEIARACQYAKVNGYNVRLAVHEYVSSGGTIGRFKILADYLSAHNALIPLDITEWLYETHPGDDVFMSAVIANDPVYMSDRRKPRVAAWTLGGGGWGGSNYETALSSLGQYIATVEEVAPVADFIFEHSHLDGGAADASNPRQIVMNADHALLADFSPAPQPKFRLTVTVAPPGSGTVVLDPVQPVDGYPLNTVVTATFVPA